MIVTKTWCFVFFLELIDTLWNVNSLLAMAKNGKIPN